MAIRVVELSNGGYKIKKLRPKGGMSVKQSVTVLSLPRAVKHVRISCTSLNVMNEFIVI